jgi:hypothetical protein
MKIIKIALILFVLAAAVVAYSCKQTGSQIVNSTASAVGLPEPDLSCGSSACLE